MVKRAAGILVCIRPKSVPKLSPTFKVGNRVGHRDPYGAKAAGEARAGRLTRASMIVQPAHGRQKIEVGDYVLANDKIAATIEDRDLSDGYTRFGGEIIAIDRVDDDGRPAGTSYYNETHNGCFHRDGQSHECERDQRWF